MSSLLEAEILMPSSQLGLWIVIYRFVFDDREYDCPCTVGPLTDLTMAEAKARIVEKGLKQYAVEQFLSVVPLETQH